MYILHIKKSCIGSFAGIEDIDVVLRSQGRPTGWFRDTNGGFLLPFGQRNISLGCRV